MLYQIQKRGKMNVWSKIMTCYVKNGKNVYYFDSFGKLAPPLELIRFLGSDCNIYYNADQY